jgi:hypothetical protein
MQFISQGTTYVGGELNTTFFQGYTFLGYSGNETSVNVSLGSGQPFMPWYRITLSKNGHTSVGPLGYFQ